MPTMGDLHFDETSCGPLCQHPQCWASNRRVERGLPRRLEIITGCKDEKKSLEYGGLPTLKVQNILADYEISSADIYPTVYQRSSLGTTEVADPQTRQRSASAPSTKVNRSSKTRARGGQSRRERNPPSRPPLLEPIQQHSFPPTLARVHHDQVCEPMTPLDDVRLRSTVYLWQPSEKSLQSIKTPPVNGTESKPTVISPRDITEDLIPATFGDGGHSRKKMRSKRSKQTPTGGRLYTHPLRTPPPIARRTLPADMDDGIAQLLSLPRDVILQIVEHTKESDLFDKEKVQALLARVMPHIRFSDNRRLTPDLALHSPPLHAMGLLRNKKMSILEGKQKFEKPEVPLQSLLNIPLVLDRSEVRGSYEGSGDERHHPHEHPRILGGTMPDVSNLLKNKITSVSAKSLPPLLPGSKVTKPFHYTIQSLDLALTPLMTPENPPSSPRSENASTLHVTFSTNPSEERSLLSTAKHPHLAVMRQESPASSRHNRGSVDHIPSYSTYKGPYSARPYGSPCAFNTPNGTPVNYTTPGPTPAQETRECHKGHAARMSSGPTTLSRETLQTIHESPTDTPDTLIVAASPSLKPRSVSPWEDQARTQSQPPSVPSNPSPDVWPIVDEKNYLHSPEKVEVDDKPEKVIPETVAPPPSPAPSVRSGILEEDSASTDGATIQRVLDCNQIVMSDNADHVTSVTIEGDRVTDADTMKRALSAIKEDDTSGLIQDGGSGPFLIDDTKFIGEVTTMGEKSPTSEDENASDKVSRVAVGSDRGGSVDEYGMNGQLTDVQDSRVAEDLVQSSITDHDHSRQAVTSDSKAGHPSVKGNESIVQKIHSESDLTEAVNEEVPACHDTQDFSSSAGQKSGGPSSNRDGADRALPHTQVPAEVGTDEGGGTVDETGR